MTDNYAMFLERVAHPYCAELRRCADDTERSQEEVQSSIGLYMKTVADRYSKDESSCRQIAVMLQTVRCRSLYSRHKVNAYISCTYGDTHFSEETATKTGQGYGNGTPAKGIALSQALNSCKPFLYVIACEYAMRGGYETGSVRQVLGDWAEGDGMPHLASGMSLHRVITAVQTLGFGVSFTHVGKNNDIVILTNTCMQDN